ncbi:Transcriptional activator protein acu-15 [Erysiphe neolycopersici]|uniref:Transcriptional activator protein acu-15 n=1 Tax=Erysiphe neolycopersici TaxID=212602 RepID=A0A420HHU3_9PEZI|nr:Transcriptional activator protein acu-15 [Erysiphe neolycopersici]
MDAADLIRQAQSSVEKARQRSSFRHNTHEEEDEERKTKCDPGLPRCLPCQRAGAVCEYYDRAKNKRIRRSHVLDLQEKIKLLEKKLSQIKEYEISRPNTEDMVRPGGFVRLNSEDETARFLGPSSGIAMTRLVMEEAKKYTDSRTIRELVPDIRNRQDTLSKSIDRQKKSYPKISALPARILPSLSVTEELVEVFNKKAQYLTPTLHEPSLKKDILDVYDGSSDPYQNFVIRMVLAISLQKLNSEYAGLADSYYIAAIEFLEEVIRPKDLKTLQCLVLVAQYSLLTPTQTAIYYVIGLATRICQQLGLTEEKTITQGLSLGLVDPIQLDLKRRLAWIVLSMEYGLAHSMGRPNSFAPGQHEIGIKFFEPKDDKYITTEGILPGPVSEKKIVAIHFLRMRLLQAEIRRKLYQMKRPEPKNENHPWFAEIQQILKNWVEASPHSPSWSRTWFFGRYQTMIMMLFRPSPQVPQPMTRSAMMCYDAAATNIQSINSQMKTAMVDITWVFVLTIYQALNTILWTISYPEIRALHPKNELETYVEIALDTISRCQDRWPGTGAAAQLYLKLTQACLRSYDIEGTPNSLSPNTSQDDFPPVETCCVSMSDNNLPTQSHRSHVSNRSLDLSRERFNSLCLGNTSLESEPEISSVDLMEQQSSNSQHLYQANPVFDIQPLQVDYRFSYFPTDNMQYMGLPIAELTSDETQPQKCKAQCLDFTDPSYSLYPITCSIDTNMQLNQNFDLKMTPESLSQEQQFELMENLEMNVLDEVGHVMNFQSL